jgi:hypothetical protein
MLLVEFYKLHCQTGISLNVSVAVIIYSFRIDVAFVAINSAFYSDSAFKAKEF